MMDTALVTFMVQTSSFTRSVDLIGSWDNFTKHYHMEPDTRQIKGQWRGCHQFKDIICDGDGLRESKRTGGLKMGSRYYYYYVLDGSIEYHDTTMPFTTSCPYLPGQPINFLWVPMEIPPLRDYSASMSSIRSEDLMTIDPADKYAHLRTQPVITSVPRPYTSTTVNNPKSDQKLSLQPKISSLLRIHSKKAISPILAGKNLKARMNQQRLQHKIKPSRSDVADASKTKIRTLKRNNSLQSSLKRLTSLRDKESTVPEMISSKNSLSKEAQHKNSFSCLPPRKSIKTERRSDSFTSEPMDFLPSSSTTSSSVVSSLDYRNSLLSIKSQFSLPVITAEDISLASSLENSGDSQDLSSASIEKGNFVSSNKLKSANYQSHAIKTNCYFLSNTDNWTGSIIPDYNTSWQINSTVDQNIFDGKSVSDQECIKIESVSAFNSLKNEMGYLSDLIIA